MNLEDKMNKKGIVFFDVDGTLIDWTKGYLNQQKVLKIYKKIKRKWIYNNVGNRKT